jgi:hypothetical protein
MPTSIDTRHTDFSEMDNAGISREHWKIMLISGMGLTCPRKTQPVKTGDSLVNDPPQKTEPQEVRKFGLRGSVGARIGGARLRVSVTQVTVSSNRPE